MSTNEEAVRLEMESLLAHAERQDSSDKTILEDGKVADLHSEDEMVNANDGDSELIKAIKSKQIEAAETLIRTMGANCGWDAADSDGCTALAWACDYNLPTIATQLLNMMTEDGKHIIDNAHINKKDTYEGFALWYAIGSKITEVAETLLKRGANWDGDGDDYTPLMYTCYLNLPSIASQILDRCNDKIDHINKKNRSGETALDIAIANNSSECIVSLLQHGASLYRGADKSQEIARIRKDDFEMFLDSQVKLMMHPDSAFGLENKNREQENTGKYINSVVLDYSFLEGDGTRIVNSVCNLGPDHKSLVKHPLIQAFLIMKWKKMRKWWTGWITLKVIFIALLLALGLIRYGFPPTPNSCPVNNQVAIKTPSVTLNVIFLVLWLFFFIIEILQFCASPKAWINDARNMFQILILGFSFYFIVSVFHEDQVHCNASRHLIGMLFPLLYLEFLFELGYNPNYSKYLSMFAGVFKSFIWYFAWYVPFLLSFTVGFALMLPPPPNGPNGPEYPDSFWILIPKVIVMFTGEQEFLNIPYAEQKNAFYQFLELFFYLVFLLLMVIVLMNLLNALAVKDAGEIKDSAEMDKLLSLLDTVAFWDHMMQDESNPESQNDGRTCFQPFLDWLNPTTTNFKVPGFLRSLIQISVIDNHTKLYFPVFKDEGERYCYGYRNNPWGDWDYSKDNYVMADDDKTEFTISQEIAALCKDILFKKSQKANDEQESKTGNVENRLDVLETRTAEMQETLKTILRKINEK